jgi:hypothetical protein
LIAAYWLCTDALCAESVGLEFLLHLELKNRHHDAKPMPTHNRNALVSRASYAADSTNSNVDQVTLAGQASLPDTGQTVRYAQTFGEDADFAGSGPEFVDNGDGSVIDKVTWLIWQKSDGGEMTWEKAKEYATHLKLANHDDWIRTMRDFRTSD